MSLRQRLYCRRQSRGVTPAPSNGPNVRESLVAGCAGARLSDSARASPRNSRQIAHCLLGQTRTHSVDEVRARMLRYSQPMCPDDRDSPFLAVSVNEIAESLAFSIPTA